MSKSRKPDNTSERYAVDEIINSEAEVDNFECETDFSRATPSGLCPNCGTAVDSEIENDDEYTACIVDHCPYCGWESDPYYE